MIEIHGRYWPDDAIARRVDHALEHVASVEVGLSFCQSTRSAIQAGGNVGLWPARLAELFARVYTFEPDAVTRECLERNVPDHVIVSASALGRAAGDCGWRHKDLGSHRVVEGAGPVTVTTIDALGLDDLDFLQLDIEGYEAPALQGGLATIQRCHPVIQVELRGQGARYGCGDDTVRGLLSAVGYRQVAVAPGSDFIFAWGAA